MKSKPTMTLDRVLSRFGLGSRTVARQAIVAGRMKVNGRTVRDPDVWVSPDRDTLQLDGQRLKPARKRYLLFYKPKGVITSHGDPDGRDTIYKYLDGVAPPFGAAHAGLYKLPKNPRSLVGNPVLGTSVTL